MRDGRVEIIDATTGRVAAGRRWSHGLHQLIEIKEGLPPSPLQHDQRAAHLPALLPALLAAGRHQRHAARIRRRTVARLPARGRDGAAAAAVAPPASSRRASTPRSAARWEAAVETAARAAGDGLPVLIGTDTVADAAAAVAAARLRAASPTSGSTPARTPTKRRASPRAGTAGTVTVTTNMAGRGTDIRLGAGVAERGGLQLLACQLNVSARIDRQLHGRCARAGDPGAVTPLLALDDGLLAQTLPRWLRSALRGAGARRAAAAGVAGASRCCAASRRPTNAAAANSARHCSKPTAARRPDWASVRAPNSR